MVHRSRQHWGPTEEYMAPKSEPVVHNELETLQQTANDDSPNTGSVQSSYRATSVENRSIKAIEVTGRWDELATSVMQSGTTGRWNKVTLLSSQTDTLMNQESMGNVPQDYHLASNGQI